MARSYSGAIDWYDSLTYIVSVDDVARFMASLLSPCMAREDTMAHSIYMARIWNLGALEDCGSLKESDTVRVHVSLMYFGSLRTHGSFRWCGTLGEADSLTMLVAVEKVGSLDFP